MTDDGVTIWRRADLEKSHRDDLATKQLDDKAHARWIVHSDPGTSAAVTVRIPPGTRTGPHVHTVSSHATCVVNGTALLWVEGEMFRLEQGDCYVVSPGQLHELGAGEGDTCWVFETLSPTYPTSEQMVSDMRDTRSSEIAARSSEISQAFTEAISGSASPKA